MQCKVMHSVETPERCILEWDQWLVEGVNSNHIVCMEDLLCGC